MTSSETPRIGDKVKIIEHSTKEYIGRTGILRRIRKIRSALDSQVIKEKVCEGELNRTGETVSCVLSQLRKV